MDKASQELLSFLNDMRGVCLQQCRDWRQGFRGNAVTARKALVEIRQAKREYGLA